MSKRKDNEPHPPAKCGRQRPNFRVACPRDSSSQREITSGSNPRASGSTSLGSTSRITTLALRASDHRLKAKHKERSHTPATATLPTTPLTSPPANSSEANSWNEAGLQAEDDIVPVGPSAEGAQPKRKRNNNAQVGDFSSMSPFFKLNLIP